MGINAELMALVAQMRSDSLLFGDSVIEIGAQDVCVAPNIIRQIAKEHAMKSAEVDIVNAKELYALLGYSNYKCIDASGGNNAILFDLNKEIIEQHLFSEKYDLVTNLGTAEHCFNQFAVFKNLHDLCKPGGVIVHALPAQGNVNHGFYNYHPRFFLDLAVANSYEVLNLSFTVDYKSTLIKYTKAEFQKWDSHDILFYAVLRKVGDAPFCTPFDGMFTKISKVSGYVANNVDPLVTEFSPYLKGGNWENTKGYDARPQLENTFPNSIFHRLKKFLTE